MTMDCKWVPNFKLREIIWDPLPVQATAQQVHFQ